MLGLRDEELGKLHQGIMLSNHLPQAVVPPIRERLGDHNRLQIPLTYPGKRDHSWTLEEYAGKRRIHGLRSGVAVMGTGGHG
jgi:hypothetical protein